MAKRLATEYVKACLHLTEADLNQLAGQFIEHQIEPMVMVPETDKQEWVLVDKSTGEEIILTLERQAGGYVISNGIRITSKNLADQLQKTITRSEGDAIVHRIYSGFTMVYTYVRGKVAKIEELTLDARNVVFENKHTSNLIEETYLKNHVEHEIESLRVEIDKLLDQRIETATPTILRRIDQSLLDLSNRLFVLEA